MTKLRPPQHVMRLSRMGASHQTRLSFMRVLLRKLNQGSWVTKRAEWEISPKGVGHAVYQIRGQGQTYSLVAFAHDLPEHARSDRVIADRWDATFALFDGEPTAKDIARLRQNVPKQEAGRVSDKELVLSRANRSVRLWDYVTDCLARGVQPDKEKVAEVGYLMRTTAVYGSGKFGAADYRSLAGRPVLDGPFRAEMLTVWLIRTFVMDLVEHMARSKNPDAARLDRDLRRQFGIGNSTGLGMAPFLVNHPSLLNAWITARETAIARVRALPQATQIEREAFNKALLGNCELVRNWATSDQAQAKQVKHLEKDLSTLLAFDIPADRPWDSLYTWAEENLSVEGQELTAAMMLEPYGDLVDDLADTMTADEDQGFRIDGSATLSALRQEIEKHFQWALCVSDEAHETGLFWYVSANKLEPRLGERAQDDGADLEQPLDIARAVCALHADLRDDAETVAEFLQASPQHRQIVRRIQRAKHTPFSEIQDNLISSKLRPIDMLRCKLAFFGATRFDPRSDRWLRITMFQGAPFPDELATLHQDNWVLPRIA